MLAQAIGRAQWKLLVLEQIKAQPRCWRARQDGLVEPSLNRFNFSGICKRYLDSNGYSLRSGGQDLGTRFHQGRPLNHLYFAHQVPVNRLLALASSRFTGS